MNHQPKFAGVLVAAVLLMAAVAPAHALSDAQERAFFSDDTDSSVGDVSGNLSDPETFAKVSDVKYRTTVPQYEIDSTTVTEFRQSELQALETDDSRSYALPDSTTADGPYGHIVDAHITFVGVAGGAQPKLSGTDRTFVGEQGLVLNHVDYRSNRTLPDFSCTDTTYEWMDFDIDDDNSTERVYTDGSRTCYDYSKDTTVDRWIEIDGERFEGNETISYEDLSAGTTTIELHAEITSRLWETETEEDWRPDVRESTSISDGTWYVEDSETRLKNRTNMTVSDSKRVRVTDNGDLSVRQVRVDAGRTTYNVLSFEGASNLRERVLWNYIRLGDEELIRGIWSVYSVREHQSGYLHDDDDRRRATSAPGTPLRQYLAATKQRPEPVEPNGTAQTAVARFNATSTGGSESLHPNVNFAQHQPRKFNSIILRNVPENATSLVTIHGKEIPIDVDNTVEYRRPEIEMTAEGDSQVRVHVEDPDTGDPIAGRNVTFSGAETEMATTDSNGNVVVERSSLFVRATLEGDSWTRPGGDVMYDSVSTSDAFVTNGAVVGRLYSLVQTGVLLAPLVLLYFYIRTYGFFE